MVLTDLNGLKTREGFPEEFAASTSVSGVLLHCTGVCFWSSSFDAQSHDSK